MSARKAATDEERIAILTRALRWYADETNYAEDDWGVRAVVCHSEYGNPGRKARSALVRAGQEKAA